MMFRLMRNHLSRTWFFLVILTSLTMVTGHMGRYALVANAVFLVLAIAKIRLVLLDYLELRAGGRGWYVMLMVWAILVAIITFTAALIAPG